MWFTKNSPIKPFSNRNNKINLIKQSLVIIWFWTSKKYHFKSQPIKLNNLALPETSPSNKHSLLLKLPIKPTSKNVHLKSSKNLPEKKGNNPSEIAPFCTKKNKPKPKRLKPKCTPKKFSLKKTALLATPIKCHKSSAADGTA